ncbi:MAG: hypothetical protein EON60_09105 [Alphaproteobacteria bacterium]|nr:MAG: hypothetical protein EON60_09105 [Alphaproteobacteria bacterium]
MDIVRFDFKIPDYTIWRAQALKSVPPVRRPNHCMRVLAKVYYRMPDDNPLSVRTFMFDDVDEPQEGFPVMCHFLGYWREELHDKGPMELVHIPSGGEVLPLALRYPAGRAGAYHLS